MFYMRKLKREDAGCGRSASLLGERFLPHSAKPASICLTSSWHSGSLHGHCKGARIRVSIHSCFTHREGCYGGTATLLLQLRNNTDCCVSRWPSAFTCAEMHCLWKHGRALAKPTGVARSQDSVEKFIWLFFYSFSSAFNFVDGKTLDLNQYPGWILYLS